METKANTALIGAFTLIVLAMGFVFIYWLARGTDQGDNAPLKIVFNDPVTGLAVGSQVVFNGIKIGSVKTLDLDPENPKAVIASLSVEPLRSVKTDTQVTLGFAGLTGVGYIEMAGGSPTLPPIWEAMPEPTITAARSSFQDIMAGARGILSRTDETLKTLQGVVADNAGDISASIKDVRAFADALAKNAEGIGLLLENVSAGAAGIADATRRLQGIVDRSTALVGAVDPEVVRSTLANVSRTTANLAEQSENLKGVVDRANGIADDIKGFSSKLPALGERADALMAAVDSDAVGRTVANVDKFTTTLADNRENIDGIVADVRKVSARFEALSARAESLIGKLDSMAGGGTGGLVEDARATLAAIQVAANNFNTQITTVGTGLGSFSTRGLRDVQSLVTDGQRTLGRLDRVITGLEQNPGGFLLGGEKVPTYGGQRR